jgi:hypothetical protein
MHELALAANVLPALVVLIVGGAFPPFLTGAFWATIGIYAVLSIAFDDETPRGVPGLDVIQEELRRRDRILKRPR